MIILYHDQEDVSHGGGVFPMVEAVDLSGRFDKAQQLFDHVALLPVSGHFLFDLGETLFGAFFFFGESKSTSRPLIAVRSQSVS